MPSLDKRKILKSVAQLQRSTSPRPKNNYSQFGVSDRSSLSKKGNHNGGLGHGYCYNITVDKYGNEYCEKVLKATLNENNNHAIGYSSDVYLKYIKSADADIRLRVDEISRKPVS